VSDVPDGRFRFRSLRCVEIVTRAGDGEGREDADYRHDHHDFDEGEAAAQPPSRES